MERKFNHMLGFVLVMACLTALDQWTKKLAVKSLMGKSPCVIWDGVFELFYSENRGAAFGMLQGRQTFLLFISLVVFGIVMYVMAKLPAARRFVPLEMCLSVICAGAAGNLIDRVSQGYVVDFLYFKLINFPIFNVADCYVTVGTAALMVLLLWHYKEEEFDMLYPRRKEQA